MYVNIALEWATPHAFQFVQIGKVFPVNAVTRLFKPLVTSCMYTMCCSTVVSIFIIIISLRFLIECYSVKLYLQKFEFVFYCYYKNDSSK